MLGARSIFLASGLALVVTLWTVQQEQPLVVDWVDAGNGIHVMRHEVTFAQWQSCVADRVCDFSPKPSVAATDQNFPVTGIGALDAQQFVTWANQRTGLPVQLPTLAQWYDFADLPPVVSVKRFSDPRLDWAAAYGGEGPIDSGLRPPGGFGVNAKAIADVKGNVWEWTSSCVVKTQADRCPAFYAAGEHEAKVPIFVRDPASGGCATGTPPAHLGLRLVWASANRIQK